MLAGLGALRLLTRRRGTAARAHHG